MILTPAEMKKHRQLIDSMSHEEMARLYRFAPSGHLYFNRNCSISQYFADRFAELGGMTPEVSKRIGWKQDETREV